MGKSIVIGLTGGIGSGKSTVARKFVDLGLCDYYNSDERAKAMYFNDNVRSQIKELLGEEAYISDTEINRKYIANIVFSDKLMLQEVTKILNPFIKADFEEFKNKSEKTFIIKENAILFESNDYKNIMINILVVAPLEIKIERVIKRDNTTREEVLKRINNQWTDEQKIPLAQYIIKNNGNDLNEQILYILARIENLFNLPKNKSIKQSQ